MLLLNALEVGRKRFLELCRHHGNAVLLAFSVANGDLERLEVNILHP